MTTPVAADSALALLCLFCEDTYDRARQDGPEAALLEPAPDPRLAPAWTVRGRLTGEDGLFRNGPDLGGRTVFYGWLLESTTTPGEFVAVIRGTAGFIEWLLDGEFAPRRAHPVAGQVEAGFWGIFETMRYHPIAGGSDLPAAQGIAQAVGEGRLTITGHSLGSALATYLAFDVAAPGLLGSRVETIVFASPRPGDSSFGAAFNFRVPAHRAYWWEHDLVPRVPFGFGYSPVPQNIELDPPLSLRICRSIACSHHALTYGSMLEPEILKSFQPAALLDQRFLKCLLGVEP